MPLVSVILPSYNSGSYLRRAIKSVIAQTYANWEIILVDDGSTDNTREIAEEYAGVLRDQLCYVYQTNRGLSAARNSAIRNARGALFALLDADDQWLPDRLIECVSVMNQSPKVGLVHARVERVDAQGCPRDAPECNPRYLSGDIARFLFTRRAHIQCPTVMFRHICVETVGGFDEAMRSVEDRDLWYRIAERYEVAFIGKVLARYTVSSAGMSANIDRMLQWQLYFVSKHRKSGSLPAYSYFSALASIYRERGDHLFDQKQPLKAIKDYARSVCLNPFNCSNLYMLARAVVKPF